MKIILSMTFLNPTEEQVNIATLTCLYATQRFSVKKEKTSLLRVFAQKLKMRKLIILCCVLILFLMDKRAPY